jgi:hypothetical protein
MLAMRFPRAKKSLNKLSLGWILGSEKQIRAISLSEIEPIPLKGDFDSGFALGEGSVSAAWSRERTKVGALLHKFKYEQDRQAGLPLADLAADFIDSQVPGFKSYDLVLP